MSARDGDFLGAFDEVDAFRRIDNDEVFVAGFFDQIVEPIFDAGAIDDEEVGFGQFFDIGRRELEVVRPGVLAQQLHHLGVLAGDGEGVGLDGKEAGDDAEWAGVVRGGLRQGGGGHGEGGQECGEEVHRRRMEERDEG